MLKDFLHLNGLLNVEGFDAEKDGVKLTAEQLTTIDNRLKADDEKIDSLNQSIADKEAQIAELEAKVNELQKQPAEDVAPVTPEPETVDATSLFNRVKNLI